MISTDNKINRLKKIRILLRENYPTNNHYNKTHIFKEILFIFFSWRTPIIKAEEVYQLLRSKYRDWNTLFDLEEDDWFSIFKASGKAKDKSRAIVKLLQKLKNDFGSIDKIEKLSKKPGSEVFEYLISLPGIKEKSAYCIMLYSMEKPVFPADAHCLRICQRLGIIKGTNERKQDRIQGQKELNELLKGDYELCYDLHTSMIQHGKSICKPNPICEKCIISKFCDYYRYQIE